MPVPARDGQMPQVARRTILIDAHIDLPYRLSRHPADVSTRTAGGDFDYPRARQGGLDVAFMSIYVPAEYQARGGARELADTLIDGVERLAREHPGKFALVHSPGAVGAVVAAGRIGLALGLENGASIENDLANVARFHARGVRYLTLAHSKANAICDSSYDDERPWRGLSPFGREVVRELNRVGMIVDVSHISDEAFEQVLAVTRTPIIASHSSCRHFTPGWERNLSDAQIRRLAASGGVVHINFGSSFIDDEYRRASEARRERHEAEHPLRRATVAQVADHIDHVVRLVGVDHVGLGSDFDGVGDSLPEGLRDVSDYPNLIRELRMRGYSTEAIGRIASGNLLRVWDTVERTAGRSAPEGAAR